MLNVMRRLGTQHRLMVLMCAALLAGFQFLMCAIVATTDVSGAMQQLLAFAPPMIQAAMSQVLAAGATDNAMLAFGWNHPITHIIGTAVAITLGARAVAGEIENGAIELVLAHPVSRAHYLTAHILFAAFAILSIAVLGVLATAIGQRVFALEPFSPARLALLLLAFLLLQLAIFAITLIASTFGREGGRAALAGLFVAVVSYMVGAIASLWPRVGYLSPYSLHHYFDPRARLIDSGLDLSSLAALAAVTGAAMALSAWWFAKRDLP